MRLVANIVLRDKNDRNFLINRPIRKTLVGLFSRVFFMPWSLGVQEIAPVLNVSSAVLPFNMLEDISKTYLYSAIICNFPSS